MSKLNIRLSYKNACILKHALRNQVDKQKRWVNNVVPNILDMNDKENKEILNKAKKELEEEKRALAAITTEIERYSRRFPKRSK